jgi:hypothetical protein
MSGRRGFWETPRNVAVLLAAVAAAAGVLGFWLGRNTPRQQIVVVVQPAGGLTPP